MNKEWVAKTEAFLKESFSMGEHFIEHPEDSAYRLEHSYRVANIGRRIAREEGFDETELVIACLLHDVAYCRTFSSKKDFLNHGRISSVMARPFLASLGLPQERIEDICMGIAMHVDDDPGYEAVPTAFARSVGDADNLDRFDAYRIYDNLRMKDFSKLSFSEKQGHVQTALERMSKYRDMELATKTATALWKEKLDFYISYYEKLKQQFAASTEIV